MNPPSSFLLPQRLGALLERLPAYPGSAILVTALNLGLAQHLPADVLQLLLYKKLRIHVRDARLTFDFEWTGQRFAACSKQQTADLTIAASAHDFLRLAQRQEDPDTLFFSRRLSMQGDTELGLVVKNALDALELPVLDLQQWAPHQVLARVAAWRSAGAGFHRSGEKA
ncbi:MAG TPA: sterol-binding protein [Polaromonas sp.]|uniref:ubiquinone anaerobic biosynthesis accessory factor UbiT n=1 Tax=Polaromonas sp. UBA4122 TaxID=1947074 RepID=UPI000EC4EC80|nr:SCP2 sterol-binding domain-containing protein [Polaromonas sp. UBA4122]HAL40665.1 sterol-binding protein [Polaromonas sp.]